MMRSISPSALLLLVVVMTAGCSPSPDTPYTDERDQQTYSIRKIGTQEWLGENLKYVTPHSACYADVPENCARYGRLYTFAEAQSACPVGWKLPSEEDWQQLERTVGMSKEERSAIRVWRGQEAGAAIKKQLKVEFSGAGKFRGSEFFGKDELVYYWADQVGPSGQQFAIYRMFQRRDSRIYKDQLPKMSLACVRCVKH